MADLRGVTRVKNSSGTPVLPTAGTLTAAAPAAPGRRLFGEMTVRSPQDAVLGTGSVVVAP